MRVCALPLAADREAGRNLPEPYSTPPCKCLPGSLPYMLGLCIEGRRRSCSSIACWGSSFQTKGVGIHGWQRGLMEK